MYYIVSKNLSSKTKTKYIVKKKARIYRGWNGSCWKYFRSDQIIKTYFTKNTSPQLVKVVKFLDGKEKFMPDCITRVKK